MGLLTIIYISKSEEEIIIPTNSIRYRIIANSDSTKDQMLKMNIKENGCLNINAYVSDGYSDVKNKYNSLMKM